MNDLESHSSNPLDAYWLNILGCNDQDLEREGLTILEHSAVLRDYLGLYMWKRGNSLIISAPENWVSLVRDIFQKDLSTSFEHFYSHPVFKDNIERIIGPAYQGYASHVQGFALPYTTIRLLKEDDAAAFHHLQSAVDPVEWEHSAVDLKHMGVMGVFKDHQLLAVASGRPLGSVSIVTLGVVSHPTARGQGLGCLAIAEVSRYWCNQNIIVHYQTLLRNTQAIRIAQQLNFISDAITLSVRLNP